MPDDRIVIVGQEDENGSALRDSVLMASWM